jgi:hypothetical protein
LELQDYADHIEFLDGSTLNESPKQLDVRIIDLSDGVNNAPIEHNVGKIFKAINIFGFKSPNAALTIYDFYLGMHYVMHYLSIEENDVSIDDMTLSLVCMHKPVEMLRSLGEKHIIHNRYKGIYYVDNPGFSIQIIVNDELDES